MALSSSEAKSSDWAPWLLGPLVLPEALAQASSTTASLSWSMPYQSQGRESLVHMFKVFYDPTNEELSLIELDLKRI